MDVHSRQTDGAVVLTPAGRIDHHSATEFGDALQPYLDRCREGAGSLILDLGQTEYMSSVGLRVLMLAARQLKPHRGCMVICGLQPVMREIFEISRFHLIFDVYDSSDEAIAALAG